MFNIIYIYFLLNKMLINVFVLRPKKIMTRRTHFINNFIQVFCRKKRKEISKLKHLQYDNMTTLSEFFFSIFEPFSQSKLHFLYIFLKTSSSPLLNIQLSPTHQLTPLLQTTEKCSKSLKKQTKTEEPNRKHSEIPTVGEVGRGQARWVLGDSTSSGHIYNIKDKEAVDGRRVHVGGVLVWGGVHLHRSTGLRS